ncbi:copper chaperone PCu(A)C [Thiothrix lacustris]|uniref:copper chaperone PCu(A)C n=1 Tax=Thiothrix lacustris TaxID=525917 RepID=UPI0027E4BE85|nr:copper chaperone PCu(A)C [Thiothrix lacustris]WMP19436.1 copper chaperone PCu(A)C [Thiothrix lacustris]
MKTQQPSTPIIISLFAIVLSLGLHSFNASAADMKDTTHAADSITIENPEVRSAAPGQMVTGAFMTLKNTSATDIDLTTAHSDIASATEIHESSMKDGMMQMEKVDKITIPANGSAELKPGGFHIMMMDLKTPLNSGEKTSITLTFSDESQKTVDATVVDVGD